MSKYRKTAAHRQRQATLRLNRTSTKKNSKLLLESSFFKDDEINALIAVTAAVNSGVTGATARVAFSMLEQEAAKDCGDVCSPSPQ